MGKRIISQARGHGSLSYRVRRKAYSHKIKYPMINSGSAEIISLIHSAGHTAPLMKLKSGNETFINSAFNGAFVGQKITIGGNVSEPGNILALKDIALGSQVYNIERNPGDGGKMMRSSGTSAILNKRYDHNVIGVLMPSKKEILLAGDCRATVGVVAGDGRLLKPYMTAGRKFYKMKARNKLWPRTSAVKMNAVDHPFGSGRGKRIKSKIAKRNSPPGTRVGHIRPRRTGRKN
jgi:large subunit ribosomal protein L2